MMLILFVSLIFYESEVVCGYFIEDHSGRNSTIEDVFTIKAQIYHKHFLFEKSNYRGSSKYQQKIAYPELNVDEGSESKSQEFPDYMFEIYDHYSSGKMSTSSDRIRSFSPTSSDRKTVREKFNSSVRRQKIVDIKNYTFNISVIHRKEKIDKAQLRLSLDSITGADSNRITIYCLATSKGNPRHTVVSRRTVKRFGDKWQNFDVTKAIKIWHKHNGSVKNTLQVQSASLVPLAKQDNARKQSKPLDAPLLIIYSSSFQDSSTKGINSADSKTSKLVEQRPKNSKVGNSTGGERRRRLMKRFADYESKEEKYNEILEHLTSFDHYRGVEHFRYVRNHCRKVPMFVDFTLINYDSWILAPKGYQAYSCAGKCYFPLAAHLTPTKHAIIQSLMHSVNSRSSHRVCCVPTKLNPISLLYIGEEGVITYQYRYNDMVVAECGCR